MDNFPVTISKNRQTRHFLVGEYLHHDEERCKYRVFEDGICVASFEPDDQQFLHICQNPGRLNEELLYLLAGQIEAHQPYGINDQIKKLKL